MIVTARADWVRSDRGALTPGDLFQADTEDGRTLALACQHQSEMLGLRLIVKGTPETSLRLDGLGSFKPIVMKFLGSVTISPIRFSGTRSVPFFPEIQSELRHGSIVVKPDFGTLIILDEDFGDDQKVKIAVDLSSGKVYSEFKPSELLKDADVFREWDMIGKSANGDEGVFCCN